MLPDWASKATDDELRAIHSAFAHQVEYKRYMPTADDAAVAYLELARRISAFDMDFSFGPNPVLTRRLVVGATARAIRDGHREKASELAERIRDRMFDFVSY